jgi:histone acetyltransferase (RNA polymerase elongator complex component)
MKRLAFFIPFQGCGRRCVYCDQRAITGVSSGMATPEDVKYLAGRQVSPVEICFFGGSFAKIEPGLMERYIEAAVLAPDGSRVTFSSYPGDFEGERGALTIETLKKYPIETIELGIPSLDPIVLRQCNRDDDPEKIKKSIEALHLAGFHLGAQMMIGLPGQTFESAARDLETIASLMTGARDADSLGAECPERASPFGPLALDPRETWDLRIYPCLVLRGTELESLYVSGQYVPVALEEAIRQAGRLLRVASGLGFSAIRVGLLESDSLRRSVVAGPYHPAFGELALSEKLALELAAQGPPWEIGSEKISQLTGHGGRGIRRLAELAGIAPEAARELLAVR